MCISPVTIPSNKILFREGIDKCKITVPCGHCWQCVQQKCNQWLVRLNSLWQKQKDLGLPSFFLTVTYAPEYRPTFGNSLYNVVRPDMPFYDPHAFCFDKKGVKQFIKDLRQHLGDGLKYFIVSEFGTDEEKQHCPHYHMLLFSPVKISDADFLTLCEFCWAKSVKKKEVPKEVIDWSKSEKVRNFVNAVNERGDLLHHFIKCPDTGYYLSKQGSVYRFFCQQGWCMYSKKHPAQIESVNGLRYTLKYLHKETLSLSPSFQFFNELRHYYKENTSVDVADDKNLRSAIRSCLPFFLASQGVGMDIYDDFARYDTKTLIGRCKRGLSVQGHVYPVPQYITRKLFYDKSYIAGRDEPIMTLNALGAQFYKEIFQSSVQNLSDSIVKCFSFDVLRQIDFSSFKSKSGLSVDSLISRYKRCNDIFPYSVAIYYYVYKDVSTFALTSDTFLANAGSLKFLSRLGYALFDYKIDNYFVVYKHGFDGLLMDLHEIVKSRSHTCDYVGASHTISYYCNGFPCFEYFDDILDLHDYIYNYLWTVF